MHPSQRSELEVFWNECERSLETSWKVWKDRAMQEFEHRFWSHLAEETNTYLKAVRELENDLEDIRRKIP